MKVWKYATIGAVGFVTGSILCEKKLSKRIYSAQNLSDKHLNLFLLMTQWVKNYQNKKSVVDFFVKHNYKTVAIYGISHVGQRLYQELQTADIQIRYVIDNAVPNIQVTCPVLSSRDELEKVDAVIVTPVFNYDEIKETLASKIDCPIISLESILYEC